MNEIYVTRLLAVMLNGAFFICAGCLTVSPNFWPHHSAYFILRNFPTPGILGHPVYLGPRSTKGTVRKGGIEYQVITGKVEGKRDRGRQRQTFLGWLGKCLARRGVDIIHLAENRTLYHAVTSNIRIWQGTIRRWGVIRLIYCLYDLLITASMN